MRKMITDAIIYPMTGALLVMEWTIDKFASTGERQEAAFLTGASRLSGRVLKSTSIPSMLT